MINRGIHILCILFMFSDLWANISSIENNFNYYLFALNQDTTLKADQDTTIEDSISTVLKLNISEDKLQSPARSMLLSGLLPGMGQVYLGKWKRAILYGLIEVAAIGTWYRYNDDFENAKRKYKDYANENWSIEMWLKDYYKWFPYDSGNPDSEWNSIREIFISTQGSCALHPESDDCYPFIWEGHHISFTWSHNIYNSDHGTSFSSSYITTSDTEFKNLYNLLCDVAINSVDKTCEANLAQIADDINKYDVKIIRDHNFYENIGKYDPFFAGWVDNEEIYLYQKASTGEKLAMSPKKRNYRNDYDKAEEYYDVAGYALSIILTNHVVSMVDALLTSKMINAKEKIDLSILPYYDHRNKWGVGGVKISFTL